MMNSVTEVYRWVIEDVINNVRQEFVNEANEEVLQQLQTLWEQKLMSSGAIGLESHSHSDNNNSHPNYSAGSSHGSYQNFTPLLQTPSLPNITTPSTSAGTTEEVPVNWSTNYPSILSQLNIGSGLQYQNQQSNSTQALNTQTAPPFSAPMPSRSQTRTHHHYHAPTSSTPTTTITPSPNNSTTNTGFSPGFSSLATSIATMPNLSHLLPQVQQYHQHVQQVQQGYSAQHPQPSSSLPPPSTLSQTQLQVPSQLTHFQIPSSTSSAGPTGVNPQSRTLPPMSMLHKNIPIQFDGKPAPFMPPISSITTDPNINVNFSGVISPLLERAQKKPKSTAGNLPQYDGWGDVHEEESKSGGEEVGKDEEPLDSDLDDEDDAEPETENIVLCQFEKIARIKNKRKCNLKDGIIRLNGRDYLFSKATGECEF